MTAKSTTVYHPTIDGVSQDVPAASVDEWAEAGWRKTKPKAAEVSPAEKAEAKKAAKVLADADVPTPIVTEA
jgi:hypothetical protein